MKANAILILLGLLMTISACDKEIIPDNDMIVGTWVAKETSINAEVEFTNREMTLRKGTQSSTQFYSIRSNSLYLYPDKIFDTENFSTHSIYLNKKSNELRIRGLSGGISDNDGFATFIRN